MQPLSTGQRLNKAADDPAGMAVAQNLDAAARSELAAMQNLNDGVSLSQTASGAVSQVTDSVKRMRALAVQGASGTLSDAGRAAIQKEYSALAEEVGRVSAATSFNGVQLADGSTPAVEVQAGDQAGEAFSLALANLTPAALGIDPGSVDLSTASGAQAALSSFDSALTDLSSAQSSLGASQNRLSSAMGALSASTEAGQSARSRIEDTDYAEASTKLATARIMEDVKISMQAHKRVSDGAALRLLG
ncbi:MAG: flagellin FliC [Deltaproteobacteria bacterium]|nr:flagellin FliC [Deltaproteobacteria bacterium]